MITSLEPLLESHPFFKGLAPEWLSLITGCAKNVVCREGFLFKENEPANEFFLIREGLLSLEVSSRSGPIPIDRLGPGDIVGWSWLFPPHRWRFDGKVVEPLRLISLGGTCLRAKCDSDPKLGYDLMRRFNAVLIDRLQATRLSLIEAYEEQKI